MIIRRLFEKILLPTDRRAILMMLRSEPKYLSSSLAVTVGILYINYFIYAERGWKN